MNKIDKTPVYIIDAFPGDAQCAQPTTHEGCVIDFENKMVYIKGIKYGEIQQVTSFEIQNGIKTVLRILIVSDNKYLNGQINFISLFEPR